jgi:hypothetical protein
MRSLLCLALLALQEKKPEKKPEPKALYAIPLSLKPGATSKVQIRGLALEQASEAKAEGAEVAIKGKGKVQVPANMEVSIYGDTHVELEIKAPAAGDVEVVIVTPHGSAPKLRLPVVASVPEKEPNGGFAQAQALEPGTTVAGAIGGAKDVDVFKIDAKAGETWTIEASSARLGSPMDPLLLAHDAAGRQLASGDDAAGGRDPSLTLKATSDGPVFVTILDAHDTGGPTHAYLLRAVK